MDGEKGSIQALARDVREMRKEQREDLKEIRDQIVGLKVDMAALKVKSRLWGLLGGTLAGGSGSILLKIFGK